MRASTPPRRTDVEFSYRNLPLLLLQARDRVLSRARPILQQQGLTEQQWRVIRALLSKGPVEQHEVARMCVTSGPSLAGILSRMEEMGLVERERLDHDQRRVNVTLTAKSRAIAVRIAPRIEALYADIESRVGADFTRRLYDMLDELVTALDDSDGPA